MEQIPNLLERPSVFDADVPSSLNRSVPSLSGRMCTLHSRCGQWAVLVLFDAPPVSEDETCPLSSPTT